MTVPITRSQHKVLNFVRAYVLQHGLSPTLQEIADGIGSKKGAVHEHVRRLVKAGAVSVTPGCNRSITLIASDVFPLELDPTMARQIRALACNAGTTEQAVIIECLRDRLALLDRSDFVVVKHKSPVLRAGAST